MSLKTVHIFFILTASALALGVGVWVLREREPFHWAAMSFAMSAFLDIYLVWFIRKSKDLGLR